jgi:hypothetical protein
MQANVHYTSLASILKLANAALVFFLHSCNGQTNRWSAKLYFCIQNLVSCLLFCVLTPSTLARTYQRFGETYLFHFQGCSKLETVLAYLGFVVLFNWSYFCSIRRHILSAVEQTLVVHAETSLWTVTTNRPFVHLPDIDYGLPRWNDIDRGKPKNSEIKLCQCHFYHHKSHMDWPERKPRPLWWEVSN